MKAENLTLSMLKEIVRSDPKQRYDLMLEDAEGSKVPIDLNSTSSEPIDTVWWIKACQGHTLKVRFLFLQDQLLTVFNFVTDSPARFETYHFH